MMQFFITSKMSQDKTFLNQNIEKERNVYIKEGKHFHFLSLKCTHEDVKPNVCNYKWHHMKFLID